MAWICVDCDGTEWLSKKIKPHRSAWGYWADAQVIMDGKITDTVRNLKELPKGTIEKLIGKTLTWTDAPYKIGKIENMKHFYVEVDTNDADFL